MSRSKCPRSVTIRKEAHIKMLWAACFISALLGLGRGQSTSFEGSASPSQNVPVPSEIPAQITSSATTGPSRTSSQTLQSSTTSSSPRVTTPISHALSSISADCIPGYSTVAVRLDFLKALSIPPAALFLGLPECGAGASNSSHVRLTAAWNQCGTALSHNSTHNTASVTLYSSRSRSVTRLEVPVSCTFPSSIIVSAGYASPGSFAPIATVAMELVFLPLTTDTIVDPVIGSGSFQVLVRFLNGTSPFPDNYTLSPAEEVMVDVSVNTTVDQIKVVISRCWATPTWNSTQLPFFLFLADGCPVPDTHTRVFQNGNGTVSFLSVRIFSFVDLDVIYLHCQIQICVELPADTCKPSCLSRSLRSPSFIGATKASFGPLRRSQTDHTQSDASDMVMIVGLALLGCGLLLSSLAAVAGLIHHKRKVGNYNLNLKPQQENFTCNVFHT